MRRSIVARALALGLAAGVLSTAATGATTATAAAIDDRDPLPVESPAAVAAADQALAAADAALTAGSTTDADVDVDASLALRDLFVALPSLDAAERDRADDLLARPTDGNQDPQDDGYTARARKKCATNVCIHWVNRTRDAPPNKAWVNRSLKVMGSVWNLEVNRLGYRKPIRDGQRGGNGKLDVYLKEVGSEGLYGYCAPERRVQGHKWLASGYCVLDDDFARSQFGAKPIKSLKVTAAHEFFHSVQFAYDYGEDRWLMEGTATWMEERYADDVNDNRQYIPYGQVARPATALDTYSPGGLAQYGNWVFFEYLSQRFGSGIVKSAWKRAGAFQGAPDQYSTQAISNALPRNTSFRETYRNFAAANTIPARSYSEGSTWHPAAPAASNTVSPSSRKATRTFSVDHMAAKTGAVKGVTFGAGWRLRVTVEGPDKPTGPAAYVIVHENGGGITRRPVRLNDQGHGRITFPFTAGDRATVTLVNASTRFNCWEGRSYSCQGIPKDNNKSYRYAAVAYQP